MVGGAGIKMMPVRRRGTVYKCIYVYEMRIGITT